MFLLAAAVEEVIPSTPPALYDASGGPWIKVLYVVLSLAVGLVVVKVLRHPK